MTTSEGEAESETTTTTLKIQESAQDESVWDDPSALAPVSRTSRNNNSDSSSEGSNGSVSLSSLSLESMRWRNIVVAVVSVLFAVTNYFYQYTHPTTSLQLLTEMQASSPPLQVIGTNGKPTVVDFWAPWCENCKLSAPTLHAVEADYASKVNFVMVNGDEAQAWPLIERFHVDAIPHLALIDAKGKVETALIGPIPKSILEDDLDVLLTDEPDKLPYTMLDVFANQPDEDRVVKFE